MAKESKARVRVFFGEIEGDDATIQSGLQSIAAAVNKTFSSNVQQVKVIAFDQDVPDEKREKVQEALLSTPTAVDEIEDDPSALDVARPKRAKKPKSYSIVKDLNLRPEGKHSLKDFYGSKKNAGQQERLVLVVYYLYRVLELQNVTVNHVYTALKELELPVPTDLGQALFCIANRKGYLETSDSKALKTSVRGDNLVEQELEAVA